MAKLLRKDVLKLIDNLTSGEYVKGKYRLLRTEKGKPDSWCCLGVWADQHGCVWKTVKDDGNLPPDNIPVRQRGSKTIADNADPGKLSDEFKWGLSDGDLNYLTRYNDNSDTWREVLHYIVDELLPKAV